MGQTAEMLERLCTPHMIRTEHSGGMVLQTQASQRKGVQDTSAALRHGVPSMLALQVCLRKQWLLAANFLVHWVSRQVRSLARNRSTDTAFMVSVFLKNRTIKSENPPKGSLTAPFSAISTPALNTFSDRRLTYILESLVRMLFRKQGHDVFLYSFLLLVFILHEERRNWLTLLETTIHINIWRELSCTHFSSVIPPNAYWWFPMCIFFLHK